MCQWLDMLLFVCIVNSGAHVLINEVNSDTPFQTDIHEFIELSYADGAAFQETCLKPNCSCCVID